MQFNSYSYLLLLPVVVVLFWALPVRARRPYVIAVSGAFCATWNVYLVALPLGLALLTHLCARAMRTHPAAASRICALGIAAIVVILAFFKYRGFLTGMTLLASVGLPLGISF